MASITTLPPSSDGSAVVPPLEHGDCLTRAEFERRYEAMPNLKKAELIEGIVQMPSPIRWNQHGAPHACLMGWLIQYQICTPGVQAGDNGSVRLDDENESQPDAMLIIRPDRGGQARISDDDYLEGAPELAAEVSASTVRIDLDAKFRVYQKHGVKEYIVWRIVDQMIDWFVLRSGHYERLAIGQEGFIESESFPGLRLDPAAMARGDMPAVMKTLQEGINSPQHSELVQRLRSSSK